MLFFFFFAHFVISNIKDIRELPLKFNASFSVRRFRWRFVQMTEFFFSIDQFPVFIADGALWIPFFCVQKLGRRGGGVGKGYDPFACRTFHIVFCGVRLGLSNESVVL